MSPQRTAAFENDRSPIPASRFQIAGKFERYGRGPLSRDTGCKDMHGVVAARSVIGLAESGRQHLADTVEKLITNSIHTAFIKYPEGDGDANMDYDCISPEQVRA
jgi:hypothetical protein